MRLGDWLNALLAEQVKLTNHQLMLARRFQVVLVDATDVSGPNQTYKLHTAMDLGSLGLNQVHLDVNNPRMGETFRHFDFSPGQLVIADRIYCAAPSIRHVLSYRADVLIRKRRRPQIFATPQCVEPLDVLKWLQKTAHSGPIERVVWMKDENRKPIMLRLIATRQSQRGEQGELQQMKRSKTRMTPEARAMAKYLVLLTTADASALSAAQALVLYRMRWQIELKFKRAKSLLAMNTLRCNKPPMVRAWLLAHLLAQALADRMLRRVLKSGARRQQAWRVDQMAWKLVHLVLMGDLEQDFDELFTRWFNALPSPDISRKKTRSFDRLSHVYEQEDAQLWQETSAA
jgi:hypothetical protein